MDFELQLISRPSAASFTSLKTIPDVPEDLWSRNHFRSGNGLNFKENMGVCVGVCWCKCVQSFPFYLKGLEPGREVERR